MTNNAKQKRHYHVTYVNKTKQTYTNNIIIQATRMHDSQHTVGNTYETSKISNRTYTPNKLMTYNSAILCIGVHVHAINCNSKEANSDQTYYTK